jgi:OFA family oxalate/formate antiporter-like MFS transporter
MLGQVFQVSMFAFCLSALFGAQIIRRVSAQFAIRVASILLGVGFVATALCSGFGSWTLVVFYGIVAASGCGIAYNAIITLVNSWFPDRIGFSSGVQMMGMGLASLVFGSVANALFDITSWKVVFFAIAVVAFILLMVISLVIKTAPSNINFLIAGTTLHQNADQAFSQTQSQNILRTKVFWLYCVWAIIVIACGLVLIGSAKQGAEAIDPRFAYGALFVGLVSACNGFGRLINGALFDRFGLVPVMVIAASVAAVAALGLMFAFALKMLTIYVLAGVLIAFPYSCVPVMASAFARQRYGAEAFAKNLGIANLNASAAALFNIGIVTVLGPIGNMTNDGIIYGLLAAMAVMALLLIVWFNRAYKKDLAQIQKELSSCK